jgi:malonyl CoA-acyl carrier protein transacylase
VNPISYIFSPFPFNLFKESLVIVYVFPGQGSQAVEMGKDLFTAFPDIIKQADNILGYSIVDLCLNNTNQKLNQTQYTQPALYVVNALTYFHKVQSSAEKPAYLAGHSLGEYNALLAAEVYDFATGLKLVKKRGELMSQAQGGGMAAIVGLSAEEVQATLQQHQLPTLTIANYNTYKQQVISGPAVAIEQAKIVFEAIKGVLYVPLKVSGAFHSSYMADAAQQFAGYCSQFSFAAPKIPVIANVTARPYPSDETAQLLTQQITHPVRWVDTIEYLFAQGDVDCQEIGPGKVLAGLIRRIRNKQ